MFSSDASKKLAVICAVLGASFSVVFVHYADAPSMVLVFYRLGFAALVLTLSILPHWQEFKAIPRRQKLTAFFSGAVLALHFTLYFTSLRYTSITSSVVLVDTEVFFIALEMLLIFHEKISKKGWVGIIVTFLGSLIVTGGDMGGGSNVLLGDAMALGGAFLISVYTMLSRSCRRHMTTTQFTFPAYWGGALTSAIILTIQGIPLFGYAPVDYCAGFGMAIIGTLLGHSIYSWALKYLDPAYVSVAKLMEPVFSSILGIIFFAQIPAITGIVGGIIIIAGIYIYASKGA